MMRLARDLRRDEYVIVVGGFEGREFYFEIHQPMSCCFDVGILGESKDQMENIIEEK